MRHRRRARGERKAAILAELEAAEKALQEAKRELAEFEAQARRDGVPPGWMREVREAGTGPASPEAP
jgi:chromosome segregation ATPase